MWAVSETTANAVVSVRTTNIQGFYILNYDLMNAKNTTPRQTKKSQTPQKITLSVTELAEIKQQLDTMQEMLKNTYDSVRVELSSLIQVCRVSNTLYESLDERFTKQQTELKTLKLLQGLSLN